MELSLHNSQILGYLNRLLSNYFPDGVSPGLKLSDIDYALQRLEYSHSNINKKYYQIDSLPVFNHLNADHFASFLWFLADTIFKQSHDDLVPVRLSYLNKIMHGLDLFYSVPMPDIFMLVHPVGSVVGHASFSNYLMIYQNCSIGAIDVRYPSFGEGVILYSKTSVLGSSSIGNNVIFGANSLVINSNIPDDSIVVGQTPSIKLKHFSGSVIRDKFGMV